MRAAVITEPHAPLTLVDREVPEPGPGEILVKVVGSGMCFSEINQQRGHYPGAVYPAIPGHEISGVVAELGPGVTWPAVGTPVGAQFLYDSCGHCDQCARGDQVVCRRMRITGVGVDGGYAEYFLARAGYLTPLPADLDPIAAAPLMCAGITAFNGLRKAGTRPGAKVAVIGMGGVGELTVRFALAMGARVAVLGRSRRAEPKARELGAELFVATAEQDPAEALAAWDGGADIVVNAAPDSRTAAASIGGLDTDGTLLLAGSSADPLPLPVPQMLFRRLSVIANPSGSPADLRDTLAFAVAARIVPDVVPVSLDEAPDVLARMGEGTWSGRAVIDLRR
ncbi:alcohol dehydrogenase catalytic domain-containing protein [Phytomonospora sp. NPDC050363]|uniref:alcohol dehydrogenase catalytic domain-containing protein n=1 Tax=Phytomonospora sp. NPDC050363 TaxID=3155642 RepID=UPI0033DF8863